eukprot:1531128-Pyramimonas_sp.AAC.2
MTSGPRAGESNVRAGEERFPLPEACSVACHSSCQSPCPAPRRRPPCPPLPGPRRERRPR